jgi:hypothetical protein
MSLSDEDRKEIKGRHEPTNVAGGSVTGITRCTRDGELWPCDAARLLEVVDEVVNFASVWREVLPYTPDDYEFTMQCVEAEAAAGLYRVLGDEDTADAIMEAHARYDTGEDSHYLDGDGNVQRNEE